MSKPCPWGEDQPTLDQFVEFFKAEMGKDDIVHRANEEMKLGLPDATKAELLTAVFEGGYFDSWMSFEEPEEADDQRAKEAEAALELAEEEIEVLRARIAKLEEARSVNVSPSLRELAAEGFTDDEAAKLIEIVEKAKVRAEQPLRKVKIVSKPGLKIMSRMPRQYWCAGHALAPGREWLVALDGLNEAQLVEIEHKRKPPKATIIVEETDVDVEVEIDDDE